MFTRKSAASFRERINVIPASPMRGILCVALIALGACHCTAGLARPPRDIWRMYVSWQGHTALVVGSRLARPKSPVSDEVIREALPGPAGRLAFEDTAGHVTVYSGSRAIAHGFAHDANILCWDGKRVLFAQAGKVMALDERGLHATDYPPALVTLVHCGSDTVEAVAEGDDAVIRHVRNGHEVARWRLSHEDVKRMCGLSGRYVAIESRAGKTTVIRLLNLHNERMRVLMHTAQFVLGHICAARGGVLVCIGTGGGALCTLSTVWRLSAQGRPKRIARTIRGQAELCGVSDGAGWILMCTNPDMHGPGDLLALRVGGAARMRLATRVWACYIANR